MKRTFLFAVVCLALVLYGQRAFAYDIMSDGIYYTELPHQLPGGGCGESTLMVVDADHDNSHSGDVVIPETVLFGDVYLRVTHIGSMAFYNCENLTSVELPNTIENIGYQAFAACPKLTIIHIPQGMVQLNSNAFSNCPMLEYIIIHDVEPFFLWDDAFSGINGFCQIAVPCGTIDAFLADSEWASLPLIEDCGGVSVSESETSHVKVYPNPASERLTLEADGLVTIIDETGRAMKTLYVNGKKTIDLEGLSRGIYFVKVGSTVKKVFVR